MLKQTLKDLQLSISLSKQNKKMSIYPSRDTNSPHLSVLYQDTLQALNPHSPGRYIDATVGAGGHAWGILDRSSPHGQLLGLDIDSQALDIARQRLASFGNRVSLVQSSYAALINRMHELDWDFVDGILLDLGVSSMQLDTPDRGFSFQSEGPLDMRFNLDQEMSAAEIVNNLPEEELAALLYQYGEEPKARRIAHAICESRPIRTTLQLTKVVTQATSKGYDKKDRGRRHIHPATLTFQALRIAVNQELDNLEAALPLAISALTPGGKLAIISFHSLEDRLVKQFFRRESIDCICPPRQPICTCGHRASVKLMPHNPIKASEIEVKDNPRARSARLRVVEKKPGNS